MLFNFFLFYLLTTQDTHFFKYFEFIYMNASMCVCVCKRYTSTQCSISNTDNGPLILTQCDTTFFYFIVYSVHWVQKQSTNYPENVLLWLILKINFRAGSAEQDIYRKYPHIFVMDGLVRRIFSLSAKIGGKFGSGSNFRV